MATIITSECINCGACEPECPNTAIYAPGVQWELDGVTSAALNDHLFYIVPSKCTECVGFHDHEACAAVCPVDCCIPDPKNLESEEILLERARKLHPEKIFGADAPSRFREKADVLDEPAPAAGDAPGINGATAASARVSAAATAGACAAESPASAAATAASAARAAASAAAAAASAAQAAASAAAALASASAAQPDPASVAKPDQETWEVPVICRQCGAGYAVPYREFHADAYFFCPACSAAFTPGQSIYEEVRRNFEWFFGRRKREREEFERRRRRELQSFEAKQNADQEAFAAFLNRMAREMMPAGKTKGVAAVFS